MKEAITTKTFKPQDEYFDSFDELCEAIKTRYTLGFREACKQMKVSRTWMNAYVRPFVPVVYLSKGIGYKSGANYHRLVFKKLDIKTPPTDQVFFDEKAFNDYVFSHVVSCKKRAKKIPKTLFMNDEQKRKYVFDFEKKHKFEEQSEKAFMIGQISTADLNKVRQERQNCWKKYVPKIIFDKLKFAEKTKRTDVPFIDVEMPDTPIGQWIAVHDVMGYGDATETIYRRLFSDGMIRTELCFASSKDGKNAKKIYYLPDPDEDAIMQINEDFVDVIANIENERSREIDSEIKASLLADNFICISETSWQEFNKKHRIL